VRIWSLADGALLGVLRPPAGPGPEGKLYAVALSPDGETVACGGYSGSSWDRTHSIYLFERRTGRLVQRLTGLPETVKCLVFSRDGTRLAVSLGGGSGIRVWDAASWQPAGQAAGYGGSSYS
jgi:WD40 repeat protein